MLALVSMEARVPPDHPLRAIKAIADEALATLSSSFDEMYVEGGRASVPPECLLKSVLLMMALFSIRSERQLVEQVDYNMLFRWFLDMDLTERVFDHSVFSKNRDRLLEHDIARQFLAAVVSIARQRRLLSDTHFSVDGSMMQAWGSMKSFRPKDDDDDGDNNGWSNFRGQKRSNKTHESKTDPDAKLMRKGRGQAAILAYVMHGLMDNRAGLISDFEVSEANGRCEREAALRMLKRRRGKRRVTIGADRGYDTRDFVAQCRGMRVTPHVAQNTSNRRSAIDGRTTRHEGYAMSISARRRIEKLFGWLKDFANLRKSRFRGRERTELYATLATAAYNISRIARLTPA